MVYGQRNVINLFESLIDNYINLTIANPDGPIECDSLEIKNIKVEFKKTRKFLKGLPRDDRLWKDYDVEGIIDNIYPTVIDAIDRGELIII